MKSIAEVLKGKIGMNTESAVCFKYAPVTSAETDNIAKWWTESSLLPKNPGTSYEIIGYISMIISLTAKCSVNFHRSQLYISGSQCGRYCPLGFDGTI
ncbi:hypothetical protein T03_17666 [Trichinella britovi]|uniref:Uncharacterized protein n=1 Tax=Trichinella britovi TaxID=45882 RepID=A0A0V1CVY8_TRIBR|nr:hypothetical protein T03_17666 [Trichinella britovi]